MNKIINGDSLKVLKKLEDDSVDMICTDPPYGYSFMGKNWDKLKGHSDVKQDINRRDAKQGEILGNDGKKLEKRINDIRKVITNPDVWNVNIASRERMDEVEKKLDDLIGRINGVSYIMKNIINS